LDVEIEFDVVLVCGGDVGSGAKVGAEEVACLTGCLDGGGENVLHKGGRIGVREEERQ
jgi:hypothetical protein